MSRPQEVSASPIWTLLSLIGIAVGVHAWGWHQAEIQRTWNAARDKGIQMGRSQALAERSLWGIMSSTEHIWVYSWSGGHPEPTKHLLGPSPVETKLLLTDSLDSVRVVSRATGSEVAEYRTRAEAEKAAREAAAELWRAGWRDSIGAGFTVNQDSIGHGLMPTWSWPVLRR